MDQKQMVVTCICEIDTGDVELRVVYLSNIILLLEFSMNASQTILHV